MGLCLGFEHAVKAAVSFGVGYKEYVQGLMGLEPKVFHVSDGILSEEGDEHMGIGEGEYDFRFLMGCVGEKKLVTLETPRIQKSLDKDVENFYILKESYEILKYIDYYNVISSKTIDFSSRCNDYGGNECFKKIFYLFYIWK